MNCLSCKHWKQADISNIPNAVPPCLSEMNAWGRCFAAEKIYSLALPLMFNAKNTSGENCGHLITHGRFYCNMHEES